MLFQQVLHRLVQPLFAHLAETRIDGLVIGLGRKGVQHAAGTILLAEFRVFRVVNLLGLLFRIEVVEVAEELVEPMYRGKMLVAVVEVFLPNCPVA